MQNKNNLLLFIVAAVLASFFLGFNIGQRQNSLLFVGGVENQEVGQPEKVDFSLFWDVWLTLERNYAHELDYQGMVYGAIGGMVDSLGDPYTSFFNPEESKTFKEDVKGVFEGVGMEIGLRDDQLTVIAPLEGTPAQRAGLRSGDILSK